MRKFGSFGFAFAVVMVALTFSFAVAVAYPAAAVAQEQEEFASVAAPSEVVGDFTIETWVSGGKTSVDVYRMVQVGNDLVKSSDLFLYYSAVAWRYEYSREKAGYTIKGQFGVVPAGGSGQLIGTPTYLKKLPWGSILKFGQAVTSDMEYGRERLYGSGFVNSAEAKTFAKKFIAYVTQFPR